MAIKVDREERPDLDAIYMDAVQQMTGQGGWPMSVFLTPDGKPFYGGTYFPDAPRHGLPSFRQVLDGVSDAWRERRAEIEQVGHGAGRRDHRAGTSRRRTRAPMARRGLPAPTSRMLEAALRRRWSAASTRATAAGAARPSSRSR